MHTKSTPPSVKQERPQSGWGWCLKSNHLLKGIEPLRKPQVMCWHGQPSAGALLQLGSHTSKETSAVAINASAAASPWKVCRGRADAHGQGGLAPQETHEAQCCDPKQQMFHWLPVTSKRGTRPFKFGMQSPQHVDNLSASPMFSKGSPAPCRWGGGSKAERAVVLPPS